MTNQIIEMQNIACPKCDKPIRCFDRPCPNCGEDMKVELIKKGKDIYGKIWVKLPIVDNSS